MQPTHPYVAHVSCSSLAMSLEPARLTSHIPCPEHEREVARQELTCLSKASTIIYRVLATSQTRADVAAVVEKGVRGRV
jgi:hypothetical protein